jgi:hypothetical protein
VVIDRAAQIKRGVNAAHLLGRPCGACLLQRGCTARDCRRCAGGACEGASVHGGGRASFRCVERGSAGGRASWRMRSAGGRREKSAVSTVFPRTYAALLRRKMSVGQEGTFTENPNRHIISIKVCHGGNTQKLQNTIHRLMLNYNFIQFRVFSCLCAKDRFEFVCSAGTDGCLEQAHSQAVPERPLSSVWVACELEQQRVLCWPVHTDRFTPADRCGPHPVKHLSPISVGNPTKSDGRSIFHPQCARIQCVTKQIGW